MGHLAAPRAKKSLGQHFLADTSYADRIVAAANLSSTTRSSRSAPAPACSPRRLVQQAGRVVAVEIDQRYVELLRDELGGERALTVIHADILESEPARLIAPDGEPNPYKVVANLPYYITSPVLRHLLEAYPAPALAVVMVQKEVAERICAQPGDLSILAVSVQFYARPELLFVVPSGAFRPAPKVDSAVLRLTLRDSPAVGDVSTEDFFAVVRAGFGQKRKQLVNSLGSGLGLSRERALALLAGAGIEPTRRAETLTLEEWGALARDMPRLTWPGLVRLALCRAQPLLYWGHDDQEIGPRQRRRRRPCSRYRFFHRARHDDRRRDAGRGPVGGPRQRDRKCPSRHRHDADPRWARAA